MFKEEKNDLDVLETKEWIDSIKEVIKNDGIERARFLIKSIIDKFRYLKEFKKNDSLITDYINTISDVEEVKYPGNMKLEKKICSAVRWNAIMMVLKASNKNLELGGHLSSFQSSAEIYEVFFNHFFKMHRSYHKRDIVYFQGHISPGIYSRAFLEGRISSLQLDNFRQEINGNGLSSYPHPKLMSNFWQFPTVSMGLSAVCSIYQAKFLKYLNNRDLLNTKEQKVYAFLGDGEMDESESKGSLTIASRESLDNLVFIINCNLQRLDGPVLGNGKIINELESVFKGCGWEVIKVIWGSKWDSLLHNDHSFKLVKLMNETVDGEYQNLRSKNGSYIRKKFFNKYEETKRLIKDMSDDEIFSLNRGGHDYIKIFNAIKKSQFVKNKPTVILFHTVKGYGMGSIAESKNVAHQIKKISFKDIKYLRDRFNIPIKTTQIKNFPYISFKKDSEEYKYLKKCRKNLGGSIPKRLSKFSSFLKLPILKDFQYLLNTSKKKISTTISFVRLLNILLNYKSLKDRIVPIIADEARTFGMEGLFRKVGIYSSLGQKYIPQDSEQFFFYKEDKKGQILQEGINELGAAASWLSAATSYSTNNFPMIPFYIYYSMFGFQRTGDLFWAAGDQQARGFLIGGTSGRTTLNGEGLQHQDGHSHIYSLTVPNCISYNPAYCYELAVIINNGLHRMYGKNQENIYYYLTLCNENYRMPKFCKKFEIGICKGIYKIESFKNSKIKVQLLGSGSILRIVRKSAKILMKDFNISSDVYSVTSFTELAREGEDCIRWNMLNPLKKPKVPYIQKVMDNNPTVAVTDYMKIYAEQIRNYLPNSLYYYVLGTDGYGKSDSRKNLRKYFEIDESYIILATLSVLAKSGKIHYEKIYDFIKKSKIDSKKMNPRLL